jgi:DNA polymerase III subunit epsilon
MFMDGIDLSGRVLVLDTETTGFLYNAGDRIIEIGIVEVINRVITGNTYHVYIDPQRDVPEEAYAVHGLSRDDLVELSKGKNFSDIAGGFLKFIGDSPLIAHNASFDMNFINAELAACGRMTVKENGNLILDTLLMANQKYHGQANNLDALCRRLLGSNNYKRDLHGALLDANLLAQVFMIMTVQQGGLEFSGKTRLDGPSIKPERLTIPQGSLKKAAISDDDRERHAKLCTRISKASGGKCIATTLEF